MLTFPFAGMIHRTGKRAKHTSKPYSAESKGSNDADEMDEDEDTLVDKDEVYGGCGLLGNMLKQQLDENGFDTSTYYERC